MIERRAIRMAGLRGRKNLRRWGYGLAIGAGMALAPFAAAQASAEPTPPAAEVPAVAKAPAAKVSVVKAPAATTPAIRAAVAKVPAATATVDKAVVQRVAVERPVAQRAPIQRPVAQPKSQRSADRRSIVVIGASISTGYGVSKTSAYPSRVSAETGRPVYVSAKTGAGYADGSIARLTSAANLPARNPGLVVLQAGSNDVGAPDAVVAGQVRKVVQTVRAQAPRAQVAVVTVFPSVRSGAAANRTDATIIDAARSVDPSVKVISPLGEGWQYPAQADGHPAAGAHAQIAERVAALA